MSSRNKINITGANETKLAAILEIPSEKQPWAYAIYAHCFTCTKDILAARHVARSLVENNVAVLRIDFTGLGDSEGEFAATNFTTNVNDLIAAANYLVENYEAPKLMVGHSFGGTASIVAAGKIDTIVAVATIGSPANPAHLNHVFKQQADEIKAKGEAKVLVQDRPFVIQQQFIDDINSIEMDKHLANLNKAILICHSPQDDIVNIENAKELYTLAKHPKSFLSLHGADHLLSDKEDAQYVGKVIANFLEFSNRKAN